jgi:hypothetical protein
MISFALVLILNNSSGSIFFNKFSIIPIRWLPEVVFSRLESSSKVLNGLSPNFSTLYWHFVQLLFYWCNFRGNIRFCCKIHQHIETSLVLGISTHSITYTTLDRRVYLVWMNLSGNVKLPMTITECDARTLHLNSDW